MCDGTPFKMLSSLLHFFVVLKLSFAINFCRELALFWSGIDNSGTQYSFLVINVYICRRTTIFWDVLVLFLAYFVVILPFFAGLINLTPISVEFSSTIVFVWIPTEQSQFIIFSQLWSWIFMLSYFKQIHIKNIMNHHVGI